MKMKRFLVLCSVLGLLLVLGIVPLASGAQTLQQNAGNLKIGFSERFDATPPAPPTNPLTPSPTFASAAFPYADTFNTAQNLAAGTGMCQAYVAWSVASAASGVHGGVDDIGSRAWFENWLSTYAKDHCDRVLVTFKSFPSPSTDSALSPNNHPGARNQIQIQQAAFLAIDWQTITGWHGKMDFIAWNEPDYGNYTGNGYNPGNAFGADMAADAYLMMRRICGDPAADPYQVCGSVAAGGLHSYASNCPDWTNATCATSSSATYLDLYMFTIWSHATGAATATNPPASWNPQPLYPIQGFFPATWQPEVFAFHDWNDPNNYITNFGTSGGQCLDATTCTAKAVANVLSANPYWSNAEVWNTLAGAGQSGQAGKVNVSNVYVTNPDPITQACTASYLLRLMSSLGPQFTRLYYTSPYDPSGGGWSLFPAGDAGTDATTTKPAFSVLASRNLAYVPPAGSTPATCPGGLPTQVANVSDPTNAGQKITSTGIFTAPLEAQVQDIYGNPLGGVNVTFGPVNGLQFSTSATGTFANTLTVAADTAAGNLGNTPPVYVQAAYVDTYTVTATLVGVPGATPAQFPNLMVAGTGPPPQPPASSLQLTASPNPPVAGSSATLSVALPVSATGTVTFTYNSGNALTCTNSANPVTVAANGAASCTTTLPASATSVSGTYTADNASHYSSASLTSVTVKPAPDFTVTISPTTQTVSAGTAASYTVNLTVSNGPYSCPVTLTALLSTSIPNATLVFDQNSLTPGSAASTTLKVTVPQQTAKLDTTGFPAKAPLALAVLLLPLAGWRRRKSWNKLLMLLVLGLAGSAAFLGCGGGDNNNGSGKPPVNYKITITANGSCGSGSLHNAAAYLVVNQ